MADPKDDVAVKLFGGPEPSDFALRIFRAGALSPAEMDAAVGYANTYEGMLQPQPFVDFAAGCVRRFLETHMPLRKVCSAAPLMDFAKQIVHEFEYQYIPGTTYCWSCRTAEEQNADGLCPRCAAAREGYAAGFAGGLGDARAPEDPALREAFNKGWEAGLQNWFDATHHDSEEDK